MPTYNPKPVSPASVREFAAELVDASELLTALASTMEKQGLQSLDVVSYDQMERSIEYANKFAGALKQAMLAARSQRGDFVARTEGEKKKPGR